MKKLLNTVMSASLLAAMALPCGASVYRQNVDDEWRFRQNRGKVAWHAATVPGTVHTDLMANDMIRDPFIGENEREVQWVDKEDWIYETRFTPDDTIMSASHIDLVFDGLDTYADVYVNDSLVLKADNMFREWRVPVHGLVRPGENTLRVYFHSPIKVDLPKYGALPFHYEAGNDQSENGGIFDRRVSVFARKAGYHYGWDWGPRLVTSGIWRPVYLEARSGPCITDVYVRTLSASAKRAGMSVTVEVLSDTVADGCEIVVGNGADGKIFAKKKVSLKSGLNTFTLPFDVRNPRLWWCNGLGKPELYDFNVRLLASGSEADSRTVTAGIRTIELVREEDADGRSFYFRLNGVPVFAKGANYIPCDNFLPRVTDEVYRRTVQDAADANMNMLRVWGGGVYEDDRFYSLCDSLGIMVWQDFMFACSMYPAEGALLDNIREEARYNVRRLRNHPSLALWCGNNECLEAWFNWGWRRRYTQAGYDSIVKKQFDDLYFTLLPEVVAEHDPATDYVPSSPFSREDGSPEPNRGDYHLWLVWGGEQPVDVYNKFRSRFFSEYGFQSFPRLSTVLSYAPDTTQHYIDSDVMLAHQRAGAGANRRIEKYMLDSYPAPSDFKTFLYMSQVLQGDAIRTAIEAHRRDRPYCMGTLFWQHNDCWPVASWSSRDYYGNWKAQHYFAKKAYRDIMLSVMPEGDELTVYMVSDRLNPSAGELSVTSMLMDGTVLDRVDRSVKIAASGVTKTTLQAKDLYKDAPVNGVIVVSRYVDKSGDVYEHIYYPAPHKDMAYTMPEVTFSVSEDDGQCDVEITADRFVRAICLTLPGDESHSFSDNYFDMLPGRTYSVKLRTTLPLDEVSRTLEWMAVY